jgi:exodeoxyribonuclease-3
MSYNLRFGGAGRKERIAEVVRACEPDLVLLQESTRPDVVEQVARAAGMRDWGSHPGRSCGFLSREPVASYRWLRTPPSRRSFLEIDVVGAFRVFNVHLSAVHSNWTERLRALELRSILAEIKREQRGFHVVAGDFNTLAPGAKLDVRRLPPRLQAVVWLTGRKIRWRTVQLMLDAAYLDVFRKLHPDDPGYTFSPRNPQVRLDYVFLPQAFDARVSQCRVVDGRTVPAVNDASDHMPLVAEVLN